MHLISLTHRPRRAFITFLDKPKMDRLAMRIMISLCVLDAILLPALFAKLFIFSQPTPFANASVVTEEHPANNTVMKIGPATEYFMNQLTQDSLAPATVANISRKAFSIEGNLITLGGDNIQVFEYSDHNTALKEASLLAEAYATSWRPASWKQLMHVYSKDTLVIFYMGNQEPILQSLDRNAGLSLTHSDENLSINQKLE